MTLLTSFIPIIPRAAIIITVPDNLYIPGATLQTTTPSPVNPKGITTGSMGSNNLARGVPFTSKVPISRLVTTEGVKLIKGQGSLNLKANLEPSITVMTELNKVNPTIELVKLK